MIYVLEITHDGMTSSTVSGHILPWLQDIEAEIRYWLEEKGAPNKPGPVAVEWRLIECPEDRAGAAVIGGGTCIIEIGPNVAPACEQNRPMADPSGHTGEANEPGDTRNEDK